MRKLKLRNKQTKSLSRERAKTQTQAFRFFVQHFHIHPSGLRDCGVIPRACGGPQEETAMPRAGKRRSKEPSTTLGRKHRASCLAPADKDLINNFLLLGWHFHRGQSEASCVVR